MVVKRTSSRSNRLWLFPAQQVFIHATPSSPHLHSHREGSWLEVAWRELIDVWRVVSEIFQGKLGGFHLAPASWVFWGGVSPSSREAWVASVRGGPACRQKAREPLSPTWGLTQVGVCSLIKAFEADSLEDCGLVMGSLGRQGCWRQKVLDRGR